MGIRSLDIEIHRVYARVSQTPRTAAEEAGTGLPAELTVGDVIQAAISGGLPTQSVIFPGQTYLDIGTAGNLIEAMRESASAPVTSFRRT